MSKHFLLKHHEPYRAQRDKGQSKTETGQLASRTRLIHNSCEKFLYKQKRPHYIVIDSGWFDSFSGVSFSALDG